MNDDSVRRYHDDRSKVKVAGVELDLVERKFENGSAKIYSDGSYVLFNFDKNFNDAKKSVDDRNLPDLFVRSRDNNSSVLIQSSANGAMSSEEVDAVIEGYRKAQKAVDWMNEVLSSL